MIAYGIGSSRYPANDGEGAKRHGGRWNHKGTAVVYCAESVAHCALEVLANSSRLPADCILTQIHIPDALHVSIIQASELPNGWNDPAPSDVTRDIGTSWIRDGATAVLSVPSSIITRKRNYLLNPAIRDSPRSNLMIRSPFTSIQG